MKAIFLDIDGVMNCPNGTQDYIYDIQKIRLEHLREICAKSGASVIMSSDRRVLKSEVERLKEALGKYSIPFTGTTRMPKRIDDRGSQIKDTIDSRGDIDGFVILDDNDDGISPQFPNNFIKINPFFALDEKMVDAALKILNGN